MKNIFKLKKTFLLFFVVLSLFVGMHKVQAVDNGNGVDVTHFSNVHSYGIRCIWFSSFDATSTSYVYNEAGGTALTSGLIDTRDISGKKTLFISIPTLNSTSITVRVECKLFGSAIWSEIYSQAFTAATTLAEPWPIFEYGGDFRVGVIVVGDASGDVVNIEGEFISEKK